MKYNVIATYESGYFKLDVIWWVLFNASFMHDIESFNQIPVLRSLRVISQAQAP